MQNKSWSTKRPDASASGDQALRIRTPEEALRAAADLAHGCPHAGALAMALGELLMNAVEHGNLELGHDRKRELIAAGRYDLELARRLRCAPYAARRVVVRKTRLDQGRGQGWAFCIEDQGPGFDWSRWVDRSTVDADAPCGRGIALAQVLTHGELLYSGRGNRVCLRLDAD